MNNKSFSLWFIKRPVATVLLTCAVLVCSLTVIPLLPLAPLPQTDIPTIKVTADFPGASAETMASAVASPLENAFSGLSGINSIISSSGSGRTNLTLQFDLSRSVDVVAQEVQAAINNASGKLPKDLPSQPSWKKVNPADMPVLVLILKSDYLPVTALSDLAENLIAKQLMQINGVAEVNLIGQRRPAIVIKVLPDKLAALNITMDELRSTIQKASVNHAKGNIFGDKETIVLQANDQLFSADEYENIVIAKRNGHSVYLKDTAQIALGAENEFVHSWPEGRSGISIEIQRQPNANIVQIADQVRQMLPNLQKMLPQTAELSVLNDRTRTIRSSLHEIQITLVITFILVLLVMKIFLRSLTATLIVGAVLLSSLAAVLGGIYLCGFSINNLTLTALVIAIGFVVDDAIVVIEHIYNHLENGEKPANAAVLASQEIFFSLVAITLSLIAAFIPLFFMQGVAGRLFFEFAATVTITILCSVVFSLSLAPMLAAKYLTPLKKANVKGAIEKIYAAGLQKTLKHQKLTLFVFISTVLAAIIGFIYINKGFFPLQDIAYISGSTQAAEDISYSDMAKKHKQLADIIAKNPAILTYTHAIGDKNFSSLSNGKFWLVLKDRKDRSLSAEELINELRPQFSKVTGIKMSLRAAQDMNFSAFQSTAQYVYTLKSADTQKLYFWAQKLNDKLAADSLFSDVRSDLQIGTRLRKININRELAAQYGITAEDIDQLIYDAFGQRQISEFQTQENQYKIVLKLADDYAKDAAGLNYLYLRSPLNGNLIQLSSVASVEKDTAGPLVINREGQLPAVNISFNLNNGAALGEALAQIEKIRTELQMPADIIGTPQGSAKEFTLAMQNEVWLVLLALTAVYIILGVLYESYTAPLVILSTIPSGLIGVILALYLWRLDFSVIALIGVIMIVGLVLKNGILMVESANTLENSGFAPKLAIYKAALSRFRPILMTSIAAILAGVPLIIGQGTGSELRQPLGVCIVGGLLCSQLLTIFSTPVIYLYIDKLKHFKLKAL